MIPEMVVTGMLMDVGVRDVCVEVLSVLACREPVVVGRASRERLERFADGERVVCRMAVSVCREHATEALFTALDCERALRVGDWEPHGTGSC